MMDGERRISGKQLLAALGVLVGAGWLVVAFLDIHGPRSLLNGVLVGLTWGTAHGQGSLSAAWCALGPLGLVRRAPLALVWLSILVIAYGFSTVGPPGRLDVILFFLLSGALILQWILVQAALWIVAYLSGRRVIVVTTQVGDGREYSQFGIRHLLILTLVVGLVLGAGRLTLAGLESSNVASEWQLVVVFGLIAVANAFISTPLILVALTNRLAVAGIGAAAGLSAVVTMIELPIITYLLPPPVAWEDHLAILCANVVQCVWILAVIWLLRAGGYELAAGSVQRVASGGG
jgi:hypothetical protein